MEFVIDLFLFLFFIAVLVGLVAWVNAVDNKALLARYGSPDAFPSKRFDKPKPRPADREASDAGAVLRKESQHVAG